MQRFSIEDQLAIADLVNRYAWASDSRDFAALAACFTDDACVTVEDVAKGTKDGAQGAQGIAAWVDMRHRAEFELGHRRRHLTMTFVLKSCDGIEAVAGSYFCVMVGMGGNLQQPMAMGFYDDRFRKVEGEWRFKQRCIYIEGKGTLQRTTE